MIKTMGGQFSETSTDGHWEQLLFWRFYKMSCYVGKRGDYIKTNGRVFRYLAFGIWWANDPSKRH